MVSNNVKVFRWRVGFVLKKWYFSRFVNIQFYFSGYVLSYSWRVLSWNINVFKDVSERIYSIVVSKSYFS